MAKNWGPFSVSTCHTAVALARARLTRGVRRDKMSRALGVHESQELMSTAGALESVKMLLNEVAEEVKDPKSAASKKRALDKLRLSMDVCEVRCALNYTAASASLLGAVDPPTARSIQRSSWERVIDSLGLSTLQSTYNN